MIPDYGGPRETFTVAEIAAPHVLVYTSVRRTVRLSWSITLATHPAGARVHLRLRLGPVRRTWLANSAGAWLDGLTVAGMAAGLIERVRV